jgi:hypothetical protein
MEFVSFGHYWLTPSAKRKRNSPGRYSPAAGVYLPEGRFNLRAMSYEL